jgi:hypothetical protein
VVDRAEDGVGVEGLHEGAGAVVDGLARDRHVVGVHDAVDEADVHPLRDQPGLTLRHRVQQCQRLLRCVGQRRVVARDRVVQQLPQPRRIVAGGEVLEGAHAQVARGHAGQHGAGQHAVAVDRLAGGGDGERSRRRDAQRVHRLADQHLAQHRPDGGLAVAAAREGRAPRALEGDVTALSLAVHELAHQQRPPVTELGREAPELVPGIGLGDGLRALRQGVAGEQRRAGRAVQRARVDPELLRQRGVEEQQPGLGRGRRLAGHVEAGQLARVAVVEVEGGGGGHGAGRRHGAEGEPGIGRTGTPGTRLASVRHGRAACRRPSRTPARARGDAGWADMCAAWTALVLQIHLELDRMVRKTMRTGGMPRVLVLRRPTLGVFDTDQSVRFR